MRAHRTKDCLSPPPGLSIDFLLKPIAGAYFTGFQHPVTLPSDASPSAFHVKIVLGPGSPETNLRHELKHYEEYRAGVFGRVSRGPERLLPDRHSLQILQNFVLEARAYAVSQDFQRRHRRNQVHMGASYRVVKPFWSALEREEF